MKKILILFTLNYLFADCSDLDFDTCLQYTDYCEWNNDSNECQDITENNQNNFIEPSCIPYGQIDPIPLNTTEYANMCMEYLGVPPTIDCGEGVHIPIYVNGNEVYSDQPDGYCDDPDFKGTCKVGSRIGRVEGIDINGNPIPEVVWVYFCRSAGQEIFEDFGVVSVQMIGYNINNGATCFFESPDAVNDNIQSNYLWFNEDGLLDGTLPSFGTTEFDQVFHSPTVSGANCMSCHNSDPFIHDPWIDNAKLPNNLNETVVPKYEYDGIDLPYFAVGGYGSQFSNASIHIEENNCLNCHRSSMELAVNIFDGNGNVLVNEFMPPYDHGSLSEDYNELIECFLDSPENTQNCNWLIPPGGNCNSEIIGLNQDTNNGDVNSDGFINVLDIIQIINSILNDHYFLNADINLDELVNILDIIELVNIILNDEETQIIDNMINKVHKINKIY
ncbi:MAG: hypothetical protein CMF96_02335 [Candidatus Marinimicrobia bacterium]|nr:hypothetical protein [Candidatus Neomarinimicrobiota bacterium]